MRHQSFLGVLVLVLCVILVFSSNAQKIQCKHITGAEGLSHPYVRCIVQDDQGYIWLGTFDGLNRYDGYGFNIYQHIDNDPHSLPANIIRSMYKDKSNNIWIGTTRGLCLYDRDHDCFINMSTETGYSLGNISIECMFKDSRGNFWIGSSDQGLILFDEVKKQHKQFLHREDDPLSLSGNTVRQVFEDSRHRLWITTAGDGVNIFDYATKTFSHFRHQSNDPQSIIGNMILSIVEDQQGYIWFACLNDGLSRIQVDRVESHLFENFQHDPKNPKSLGNHTVRALCVDDKGGLWIGSENGGLMHLPQGEKNFTNYVSDLSEPTSLSSNSIYTIFQDATSDIWIGTFTAGVDIIHQTQQAMRRYSNIPGNRNTLSHNYVWKFSEDNDGTIWIATDGGGLNKFSPETEIFESYTTRNSNLNKDAVLTVCTDSRGTIWVGTWHGGMSAFNPQKKSFRTFTHENSALSNNDVFDIVEGDKGILWIATHGGLNKFDIDKGSFTIYRKENSGIVDNDVEVVKRDSAGNLILGTVNGMSIFSPKDETWTNYRHDKSNLNTLSDDFITSINCESSNIVWIATINGLNRLDRSAKKIARFTTDDGLANNLVFGIETDNQGNLWISTSGGISSFVSEKNQFITFTKEDGLQDNVFIKKSHLKTRGGKLLFGGVNGFNVFDPKEIKTNQAIPQVVFTDFQLFNKSVKLGMVDSPLKRQISQTDEIVLSYKQNVFSFGFSALNYINSTKNQYAYMLEGFDKDWNYIGTRRTAHYTNINPGKYIFRVKGSNNNGVWNQEGISLSLIITPPFWETIWFRLLGIAGAIGLLITWYTMHTARIRARNRVLEERVAERTAQLETANKELETFAYSVSHDLRAPLRAIDGYTSIFMEDHKHLLTETGKRTCAIISEEVKRMGQLIEDFLALSHSSYADMNISCIDMESMARSVCEELKRIYNHHPMEFHVAPLPAAYGDPSLFREVWTNLISNAIKFSSKKEQSVIDIDFRQNNHMVTYSVKDNGAGFDMQYSDKLFGVFQRLHSINEFEGTGVGLAIVKRLVNRHGGEVWAESQLGQGATFYFTVKKKGGVH